MKEEIELSKGVKMYSGTTSKLLNDKRIDIGKHTELIFFGTKSELHEKGEEFWKGICEMGHSVSPALIRATESKRPAWRDYTVQGFQSLKGSKRLPFKTAKESGHSALSLIKERFVVVVREKTKN